MGTHGLAGAGLLTRDLDHLWNQVVCDEPVGTFDSDESGVQLSRVIFYFVKIFACQYRDYYQSLD